MVRCVFSLAILALIISCDSEIDFHSEDKLVGIWISVISADTLFIIDQDTFQKRSEDGLLHTYDFSLKTDSIEIQYIGPREINIQASIHYFYQDNNTIVIDFTNGCYGFDRRYEVYFKDES